MLNKVESEVQIEIRREVHIEIWSEDDSRVWSKVQEEYRFRS